MSYGCVGLLIINNLAVFGEIYNNRCNQCS